MTQLLTKFESVEVDTHSQLADALNKFKAEGYVVMRYQIACTGNYYENETSPLVCLLELGWRKEDLTL